MTKLCPRGKAAAKRKFKVYPSAYANAYASKICAGKIKDPSGVKRKDFRGRKPAAEGGPINKMTPEKRKSLSNRERLRKLSIINAKPPRDKSKPVLNTTVQSKRQKMNLELQKQRRKNTMAGGGLMEATQRLRRQGLRGGGICTKGMNRDAVGKNS